MIPAGDINVARERGSIQHVQQAPGGISTIGHTNQSIESFGVDYFDLSAESV
jgi:hypothetical protein